MYFNSISLAGVTLTFLLIYFILKRNFILSDNIDFSNHKKFVVNNNSPIVLGGIFFTIILLFFFKEVSIFFKIFASLLFILGLLADTNFLLNTKFRFITQILLISSFILIENLSVSNFDFYFINKLLVNDLFKFFLTCFCILVLINGCNFIDGLNGLLSGYSVFILLSLYLLNKNDQLSEFIFIFNDDLSFLLFSLLLFLIFNFFGFVILGDSGSYLIGFTIGVILIKISSFNSNYISPLYFASLLWYPAFETLFSILRRIINNFSISKADNYHLHHLVYIHVKKKNFLKKKSLVNSFSSLLILIFCLPGFILANNYFYDREVLLSLLTSNVILYLFFYFYMKNRLKIC